MDDYKPKTELHLTWENYILGLAPWKNFVTLTFREFVTRDQAEHMFRFLLQVLNRDLFGNHYTRIVGHHYSSYVVGFETQKRGALHMHVLFDRPVNFTLLHAVWNKMAGFAWIEPVSDPARAVAYVSKYIVKGGDLVVYRPVKVKEPVFQPLWYSGL